MIAIAKGDAPEILVENEQVWTDEYRRYLSGDKDVPKAASRRYAHPQIKDALKVETAKKCVYCESRFAHVHAGDIDHIAPKKRFPMLVVSWANLTLSCRECNRRKGDYYDEQRRLLNPYADEPSDHLEAFGPLIQARIGSLPGAVTESRLDLNRSDLLLRRSERLNELNRLRQLAATAQDDATRDFYIEELQRGGSEEEEFSLVCRNYVQAATREIAVMGPE